MPTVGHARSGSSKFRDAVPGPTFPEGIGILQESVANALDILVESVLLGLDDNKLPYLLKNVKSA